MTFCYIFKNISAESKDRNNGIYKRKCSGTESSKAAQYIIKDCKQMVPLIKIRIGKSSLVVLKFIPVKIQRNVLIYLFFTGILLKALIHEHI
jgi:hypothetical protein